MCNPVVQIFILIKNKNRVDLSLEPTLAIDTIYNEVDETSKPASGVLVTSSGDPGRGEVLRSSYTLCIHTS